MDLLMAAGTALTEFVSFWMDHLIFINVVLSVVIVFFERRDPRTVWTWLLCFIFYSDFGVFLYFMIGYVFHKQHMFPDEGDRGRDVFRYQQAGGDDHPGRLRPV